MAKKFIQGAIKRPGVLTRRAKAHNRSVAEEANIEQKSGTALQKQEANFYLNVLSKIRRKRKTLMGK